MCDMGTTPENKFKEQIALLPLSAGVYQFIDKAGKIIYVGKAKSLRRRVSSYFMQNKEHSAKVRILVKQIVEIRHIVVETEVDALLLENSLIKTLQPRYNIMLKDDKTYPWIVVRNEPFPRVQSTRVLTRDGSQYFGPYGSVMMQRSVLEFIREVVPLRTCKLNLSQTAISKGNYNVCLQYHIGNCKAPCVGKESENEYQEQVNMVVSVLKGDLRPVRTYLEEEQSKSAAELRFELAHRYKTRINALDNYASRSVIVSAKIIDTDLFSLLVDDDIAYCNFVRIRHGSIIGISTIKLSTGIATDEGEILTMAIQYIIDNISGKLAKEVIVPFLPSTTLLFDQIVFTIPQRGEKKELLEFSQRSARIYRAEQMKNLEIKNPERHTERLMNAMQKELFMSKQPRHIECFDNSNLQGTNPVASCVVFRNGKPSVKEYRHFNIKSVVGADDFASMREVVFRRYSRLLAEGAALPDLIIVDGGKGQLSSAFSVLCELGIEKQVTLVGLAKRIEELFFPNNSMPYYLSRTGEPLKVICHLRNEAHRFGVTFHRQKRSADFIHSELENISGIGPKTIELLLRHFKSVARIKVCNIEELSNLIGESKSKKVKKYFAKSE